MTEASAPKTTSRAAADRRAAVRDFKRQAILQAAKRVFGARGLDGASMRAIAAEAGYTVGALYGYYAAKEHIYADILSDSLAALATAIKAAIAGAERAAPAGGDDTGAAARAAAFAFYAYYRAQPDELDLSFYLLRGIGPRGLTPELDRHLNGRLIAALRPISVAIARLGALNEAAAATETVAAACHMSGVLLLERSGRLKVLGHEGGALVGRYLEDMAARLGGGTGERA